MSKYRTYGARADELARAAFKEVMDASKRLADAESKAQAYPQRSGMVDPEYYAKSARAAADLAEAKAAYETAKRGLVTLNNELAKLRTDLQNELAKDNRADPDAVDTATMDLLKSGILNTDDYIGLFERHSGNITMQRLIKSYAMTAADNMHNTNDRQRLKAVALGMNTDSVALQNFDVIAEVCRRAESNTGMIQHYDELTASALQNM